MPDTTTTNTTTVTKVILPELPKQLSPKTPTNSLAGDVQAGQSVERQVQSLAGSEKFRQNVQGIRQGTGWKAPIIKPEKPYGVITGDNIIPEKKPVEFSQLVRKIMKDG